MELAKTDYHVHPDYSPDASPYKIKDYCYKALELGLREICFTTHIEVDPVRKELDNYVIFKGKEVSVFDQAWLDHYFLEIADVQREFKSSGLQVKAGIEVGYSQGMEKFIEKITDGYPFDFVLGAIHCLEHIAISSKNESPYYYKNRSIEQIANDYFTVLEDAVKSGLFDCMAHLDIYVRYGLQFFGDEIYTIHQGRIEPIFQEMARRGMGIEINTSSRRRGIEEFHPSKEIVALAAETGIKVFTIGSDAHNLSELGGYLDEAMQILQELNLKNHVFNRRRAVPYG
ncbi:MAG: histidinol-phosphatase HisJ family protein [Clostridia bacterium]|nr:histidinol-phosphatase HisJ family protein [Clostridia bacterium]